MILFFAIAVGFGAFLYIAAPFWRGAPASAVRGLVATPGRRETIQRELTELEFDRATGKVEEPDYELERNAILARSPDDAPAADTQTLRQRADAAVEAEILILRTRRLRSNAVAAPAPAGWTCACGRGMAAGDRFCANCGTARNPMSTDISI